MALQYANNFTWSGSTTAPAAGGTSDALGWPGGKGTFWASGTFGGGTCKLQAAYDGSTYVDVPNSSFTSNGMVALELAAASVKCVLTAATGSSVKAGFPTVPTRGA